MAQFQQYQQQGRLKISPDEYVDLAIKGVLNHYPNLSQKDTQTLKSSDWAILKDLYTILVNQAEGVCEASGYISSTRRRLDFENLKPEELELLAAAEKYIKSIPRFVESSKMNIQNQARRFLIDFVEDSYSVKVGNFEYELDQEIEKEKDDKKKILLQNNKQQKIDFYRLRLMILAVNKDKGEDAEMDA